VVHSTINRLVTTTPVTDYINPVDKSARRLKIAMIGQKGLPATYGGIEHHVENLSTGLASLGHDVTVFCRPYYCPDLESNTYIERIGRADYKYKDVRLKLVRSLKTKHLDAISHSLFSILHAIRSDFDIIHIHGIGPSLVGFIPRLAGKKLIATVHALDYRQKKWGRLARLCLKAGLKSSVVYPNRTICVSRAIQECLGNPRHSVYAPNGVKEPDFWGRDDLDWIRSHGLEPGKYILFVGRLIEDKNCHLLARAVARLNDGYKLAVAGDSSFTDDYVEKLKCETGPETVFLGNVYNDRLSALYANCALFVLPSSVEGLPIVLIEAMKHKAPALASDIPENMEILDGDHHGRPVGLSFINQDFDSLLKMIRFGLEHPQRLKRLTATAYEYVNKEFSWQPIVKKTEQVYLQTLGLR